MYSYDRELHKIWTCGTEVQTDSTNQSTVIFWLTEIMTVHKHLVHCVGMMMLLHESLHSCMKNSYIMSALITW